MKKYLSVILALLAVAAIVVSCVFGVQKGDLQKNLDTVKADLEKTKTDAAAELEKAKTEAAAELEKAKTEAAAELTKAQEELEAAKQEAASSLESAKGELQAKIEELEARAVKAERAAIAAASNAYIMYANADWSIQNWGTADAEDGSIKVTPAAVTGAGDYTVGLEFANESAGLAFTAIGIKGGEYELPGYYIKLNAIRVNGTAIETGTGYTSSDDGKETRMNLYNEWVSELPADARVYDGNLAEAKPVIVDKEAFAAVKTIEVDFSVVEKPIDTAYIMIANGDWSTSYFLDGQEHPGVTAVNSVVAAEEGTYTASLEFADGLSDVSFMALGLKRGEITYPNSYLSIREIRVDGTKVDLKEGVKEYTSSDDKIETRVNIVNEWVSSLPEDARRLDDDLEGAAPVIVDKDVFKGAKKIEIDFSMAPISAYLMFANADWSISNWGYTSTDAVTVQTAALKGEGSYTVGLEFATPSEGLAFTAVGIKNGEKVLPNYIIKLNSVTLNGGEENILNGINYTSSDDGKETRANIYNEWVAELPADARNKEGNLDNASPKVVDPAVFTGVKSITVNFDLIKGKEAAAAPADENKMTKEKADELKKNGFNAYIGVQTTSYIFRNTWDEAKYGRDSAENPDAFKRLTGWDADNNMVDYGGTFQDAAIKEDGTYTVSLTTGEMGFGTDETFRMLFASTDIPSALISEGYLKIDDVQIKIGDAATQKYTDVDTSGDYARIVVFDEYNRSAEPFGYKVPGANETITITFTVSGMAD